MTTLTKQEQLAALEAAHSILEVKTRVLKVYRPGTAADHAMADAEDYIVLKNFEKTLEALRAEAAAQATWDELAAQNGGFAE